MKLYEVLQSKVPWQWIHAPSVGRDTATAKFAIDGKTYTVDFYASDLESITDEEDIKKQPPHIQNLIHRNPVVADVAFYLQQAKGQTWGITGTGNQYAVMSTVLDIISAYMSVCRTMGIEYLHLSAKEPSRIKLYDRLLSRMPNDKITWTMIGEKRYLIGVK